jgi:glycosyltransferase involved in cell wall biosynthesis
MRVAIVRAIPGSLSMDAYADGLVAGLKAVRPQWEVSELAPYPHPRVNRRNSSLLTALWKYYDCFWHYPQTVVRQQADVFHIIDHSYGHLAYWLRKIGVPIVVTCHDLINLDHPENISTQARLPSVSMAAWRYSVWGLQSADHTIAVSSITAKDVEQKLNIKLENITVVPDAVDSLFSPLQGEGIESFRLKYGILPETICLLHVGAVAPRKNISTILKVLETLRSQNLPIHLLKTGENFSDEQKTFIQTYDLENFITHLGKVDRRVLVQVYNAADILLFPSLYEGFGMPVLEAMACGTPVITSNVSSLPGVAGDAAILVEPTDVQAIVEAILRLKSDYTYCKWLINKGFVRAKSFTWEEVAEQVSHVYQKVTSKTSLEISVFR